MLKPSYFKRKLFFIIADSLIILFSTFVAFGLRFDFNIADQYLNSLYVTTLSLVIARISLYYVYRIYDISWRHFGFKDTTTLVLATIIPTVILIICAYALQGTVLIIPRSIIPIEFFITLFMILTLRVSKRLYIEGRKLNLDGKPTIIIADLDRANSILRTISHPESQYYPVAIIDKRYSNVKVNRVEVYSLEKFASFEIECEVAVIDKNIDIAPMYDNLKELGITTIKVASDYSDYGAQIQDVSVEDLLARHPKDLDKNKISEFIKDKVILVTGAGGSIGSEICRQCEAFGAKKLILVDHSEYNLYMITEELGTVEKVSVMQSVTDLERMRTTFEIYSPDIVIHAAAYKHVPLVEENIEEAITNNVIGTKNVIDLSIEFGVKKVVLISTDKAVRPTNVMGTTKRICELYAQNAISLENAVSSDNVHTTDIVAVRFGNVLGSSGSVIPKFRSQIEKGGPITVTHPDITRYFMLINEACELVLQAGAIATGGDIFILDMGEPVKIVDLAKKMLELSGKEDIQIEFSGLRPGEKLYEELLIDDSDTTTEYESITVAAPTFYDINKLNLDIQELLTCKDKIKKLQEIVPEFQHRLN